MHNKVNPTEKQRSTFEHIKRGMALRDAMLAGGYSEQSARKPKQNFTDREGVKSLKDEWITLLNKNGFNLDMLAELQIEGLFDNNGGVRLQYIKEFKEDLGLKQPNTNYTQINGENIVVTKME